MRRNMPQVTGGPPGVGIYQSGVNLNQQIESKMGRNSKLKTKLGPFMNQSNISARQDPSIIQELNAVKGQPRYRQNMKQKNNLAL